MADEIQPDMACVPYRRKGLYYALTIPFLALLVVVLVYLWTFSFVLSLVFALFFFLMSLFQAYCCAYQECPYVGGFCPAVIGIMPASLLAKLLYSSERVTKSKRRFDLNVTLAVTSWLGLIVFPLYWIGKLGIAFAVGYVLCHIVYTIVFGITVCPACAIRQICPGGKLGSIVWKRREEQVGK
jgi:hypothetical protein